MMFHQARRTFENEPLWFSAHLLLNVQLHLTNGRTVRELDARLNAAADAFGDGMMIVRMA